MRLKLVCGTINMTTKVSKRLVIDASVARAAGGEEAINPTSKSCRDFLKAVLEICHKVVMSPDVREEWKRHESRFSREWRLEMVSKRKLIPLRDIYINEELWSQIEGAADTDKKRAAMIKDLCLIEAAIVTDKVVVSLDDNTARSLFAQAANKIETLGNITWVNPDKPEEEPIDWLNNGAQPDEARLLRNWGGS